MPLNYQPTQEQEIIIDTVAVKNEDATIEAGAGSGKTSTLRMLSEAMWDKTGLYLAYNKAIQLDAAATFPANVKCATAHSVAYQAVGKKFYRRLQSPRQPGYMVAKNLGIVSDYDLEDSSLNKGQLGRIVMEAISRFCHSSREMPIKEMIYQKGLKDDVLAGLQDAMFPYLEDAWYDLQQPYGKLKFDHDHYLKIWQLTHPVLDYDFVLLDEAQDANPVIADVVERQVGERQVVLVGDRNQAIYGWRGATDAMESFSGRRLYLSQSFRFGPAIANEANKWLKLLEAPINLTGYDAINSYLDVLDSPHTILCRTNAGCVSTVMEAQMRDVDVALVGGGQEIERLAKAAIDLMQGKKSEYPQLAVFSDWNDLRRYVNEDSAGSDLRVFVRMIDELGPDAVIQAMNRLVPEEVAELIVSTAHKAKGREWTTVQIHRDFDRNKEGEKVEIPGRAEMMLNYVAITRAKGILDRGGLSWVDRIGE